MDCKGATSSFSEPFEIFNMPPKAWFFAWPFWGAGEEIFFDGSYSYDPDGEIVRYEWDFGDGNRAEGAWVTHTYSEAGIYTVTLTVTDNEGATSSFSETFETNMPPVASFTYSPEKPVVGKEVTFDAASSYDRDGVIVRYEWNLGDGNIAEGEWVTHTYSEAGTYTVSLTVTDNLGAMGATSLSLKVTKEFMITFDDGPLPAATEKIVEALKEFYVGREHVRAGFFMVGDNDELYHAWYDWWTIKGSVKKYPDVVQKVAEAGHLIGNHTQHHASFTNWHSFFYDSMRAFVRAEIWACENEIDYVINNPIKIFRPPYLYYPPEVREGAEDLGYTTIWGELVGDVNPFASVETVKKTALQKLKSWDKEEPVVFIFHAEPMDDDGKRPVTYDHIVEIIHYLQDQGFTLTHFDPTRISLQKIGPQKPTLSGVVHSPVALNIVDPDGLTLNAQVNQIPGALYEEIDVDGDGSIEGFFVIPESKSGNYLITVTPKPGALPGDTYTLEVGDGEKSLVLAKNRPISDIPTQPYIVRSTETGLNMPPVANAGPDQTVEQETYAGTEVILDGSGSTDPDSTPGTNNDIVSFEWYEGDNHLGSGEILNHTFSLGTHAVRLVVTDSAGLTDDDEMVVTVRDTTPPEFTLSVSPTVLWPPNHNMVLITPSWTVRDKCDPSPTVSMLRITMNEGDRTNTYDPMYDDALGDGRTIDDIQVVNGSIYLRAERCGTGAGRVYTITYRAVDRSGNVTTKSATVTVPHDQR
jgi:peptidoglycan/xylan/chitin deacetylase (PgdA/CDA1 family)